MPLVRIDLPRGRTPERRRAIADVVYGALRATLDVPDGDRFQVIAEHDDDGLLIDPAYLGVARSRQAMIIQVTLSRGRSREKKLAFYRAVADGLHARVGLRREDVFINLVEVDARGLVVRQRRSPIRVNEPDRAIRRAGCTRCQAVN